MHVPQPLLEIGKLRSNYCYLWGMLRIIVLGLIITLSTAAFSQKKEGYLQYAIEVEAVDTSLKAKQQEAMLRNSKMEIYYKRNFSRVDFKMGQMYSLTAIVDKKADRTLSLISSPMGKFATRTITSATDSVKPDQDSSATVELFDETKKILDYECKKAVLTVDGKTTTYWYTNEFSIDLKDQSFINSRIPGFPMEFYTIDEGVKMHFQASNIEFNLDNKPEDIFSTTIPAGYTLIQDTE